MNASATAVDSFRPNWLIANHQIQSILASKSPRRKQWLKRGSRMEALATAHVLEAGNGVQLTGRYSRQPSDIQPRGLCVLIHGWEGHHDSSYLYSMACQVFATGWNVFRLNLRDHAGTHALNEALFHSARMDEVLNAIKAVQGFDGGTPLAVIGFSLGGNFALRVGLQGPAVGVTPVLSIGISPSINPGATLRAIDEGPIIFRRYFLSKWRQTLRAKAAAWPGRYDFSIYDRLDNFIDTTRQFVSEHTDFASLEDYLEVYTLRPPMLMDSLSPLAILTAQDDTVIPITDFAGLEARGSVLAYDAPAHGGHCGFIENLALESWAERRVLALLSKL
jgi:predicted alpha/beta-fold hydrolase